MKILYAPWRENYAVDVTNKQETTTPDQCIFCAIAAQTENDTKNFVLKRYEHSYAILNRYPYNAGHVLIIPYAHFRNLADLSQPTQQELIKLISSTTTHIQKALICDGINVGINMGKAAGAGIPAHLHVHVLPRWTGDTNFLPALADTKAISFDLNTVYQKLLPYFL